MTPAGTSNELDVQNEWEENTHTHYTAIKSTIPLLIALFNVILLVHRVYALTVSIWGNTIFSISTTCSEHCLKENMNASKPSHQSKGLGGNIGCNASRPWCLENVVSHIERVGCQPGETTKFIDCGQSHSWSSEQGKENKMRKSGSAPPPPRCSFRENKIK